MADSDLVRPVSETPESLYPAGASDEEAQEAILRDIDAMLDRIDVRIAAERAAMEALLQRITGKDG